MRVIKLKHYWLLLKKNGPFKFCFLSPSPSTNSSWKKEFGGVTVSLETTSEENYKEMSAWWGSKYRVLCIVPPPEEIPPIPRLSGFKDLDEEALLFSNPGYGIKITVPERKGGQFYADFKKFREECGYVSLFRLPGYHYLVLK